MKYIQAKISDSLHREIKILATKDEITMPEEVVLLLSSAVKDRSDGKKDED